MTTSARTAHGGSGERTAQEATLRAVAGARDGDADSISYLYEHHSRRVHRYLRGVVGAGDAEDLTQQVFLKLLVAIRRYEPRDDVPFISWLLRVAHNVAIDHLRAPRPVPTEHWALSQGGTDEAGVERARSLREALSELPPVQRRVLVLRHVVGLTPVEIATMIGKSESSVHGLHHRGRGALKRELVRREAAPATLAIDLPRAA